jgi:UPF0755 protein
MKKRNKILLFILLTSVLLVAVSQVLKYYKYIYEPNVVFPDSENNYLFIPTGSDFTKVKEIIFSSGIISNPATFEWVARKKGYDNKVRPGRYKLRNGMNNNDLVNLLRLGKQEPVRVVFQNIRTKQDLAGKISHQLEVDSLTFLKLLQDPDYLRQFNVTSNNVFILFIPNTYEFFWNTTPDQFIRRMNREHVKFWSDDRKAKAKLLGFTIPEIVTLASIVEKETAKDSEKPAIAGVYINRLKKGWPLQADPTLIFAWNDYTIKRVLNKHKEIQSPYNTYLNGGIPPGPICLPSISSIESVLNYEKHNYFYFCAKDDLSGYHNFGSTLAQHNRNAKKYQEALKKLNIR